MWFSGETKQLTTLEVTARSSQDILTAVFQNPDLEKVHSSEGSLAPFRKSLQ